MFKNKGEKIKVHVVKTASTFARPASGSPDNHETLKEFTEKTIKENQSENNFLNKKPKKIRKVLFFIFIFLILVLGTSIAGFLIFNDQTSTESANVDLKIQTPFEVSSGSEIEYKVEIKNREKVALEKNDLLVQYPYGFEFIGASTEPVNETKNSFFLPDIPAGDSYLLKVRGRLVGEIGETKNIDVLYNYQPANFNSNFQIRKTAISLINDSIIKLEITSPEKIIGTQNFSLKISYQNNDNKVQENLKIELEIPDDLIIEPLEVNPAQGQWYWLKNNLAPGQSDEIQVNAHYDNNNSSNERIEVKAGFMENELYKVITYKRINLVQVNPEIDLALTINDQEELKSVAWGEELSYQINIKNNSTDFSISNVKLKLLLPVNLFNKETLVDDNSAVWVEDGLIWGEQSKIWDDYLKEFKPDMEKAITVKIKIIAQPDNLAELAADDLSIKAEAQLVDIDDAEVLFTSKKIISIIGGQVLFSAKAFYYLNENIQVGSGPIPPAVGQTTNYKIYWTIDPGANNLENITVRAILPPAITWIDDYQPTAGVLDYDPNSRQVIWNLDELLIGDSAQAYFFVDLTPDISQLGQVVTLLNPSTFSATTSQNNINQTSGLLDTDLQDDPVKNGQGAVVQ